MGILKCNIRPGNLDQFVYFMCIKIRVKRNDLSSDFNTYLIICIALEPVMR